MSRLNPFYWVARGLLAMEDLADAAMAYVDRVKAER